MGRTDWDRACTMEINPSAEYHFCNETLRPEFYVGEWNYEKCRKHSIFMSQGYNSIKGMHYMLEALNIIKRFYPDVKLYVTGTSPLSRNWIEKQKRSVYVNYLEKLIRQYSLEKCFEFSKNAKQHAKTTHDANQNLSALIDIYRSIAQKNREVDKDGK